MESAEGAALRGAATLRRDRPRLAVAGNHRPDDPTARRPGDPATLAPLITSNAPNYRFGLGHFTSGLEETILRA